MNKELEIQAFDLLKQIITIPSVSGEENFLASFLLKWFTEKGFQVERLHNNIWVKSIVHENAPVILLNSHMDTVKAVDGWTIDPFIPEETQDKIFGLGSSDAGGSLVSLVLAFIELSKIENRAYNLILLISAEEENSGPKGISTALEKIGKIDLAIVGEPTELQMAICERGLMVLDCYAYGKAGHVAHKNGVNAITKAIKDIAVIKNIKFPESSDFLGNVELEVTQINAGYQHNVIPDKCHFVVDVRVNEKYSNEEIFAIVDEKLEAEVKPRSFRLKSSFIDDEHKLVNKAKKMNIKTFGSKTMSDQALIPAPSIKIGPGKSSLSHKADEYIEKVQIKKAIDLYINLLKDFKL